MIPALLESQPITIAQVIQGYGKGLLLPDLAVTFARRKQFAAHGTGLLTARQHPGGQTVPCAAADCCLADDRRQAAERGVFGAQFLELGTGLFP